MKDGDGAIKHPSLGTIFLRDKVFSCDFHLSLFLVVPLHRILRD